MKVKNLMFSGFAAAMFAGVIGGADAATYNLASKDYVDTKITGVDTELQAVNTAIEKKVDKTTYETFVAEQAQTDADQDAAIALIKGGEDGANGITDLADRVSDAEGEIDTLQTDIEKKEDIANKVQTKTAYDALGAQDDKTKLYTSVAVAEAIAQSIATSTTTDVIDRVDTLESDVGALETTVGNAESGLVKDVTDLKSADTTMGGRVDALETDVNTLESTVGDANSGLVKDVTDLKTADTTMGNRVGALETTVGDATNGLVKDVADLKSADTTMGGRVDALETDVNTLESTVGDANSGLVKDVTDLKSADTTMGGRVDALETDVDALEGSVQTLQDANYINTDGKDLGGYIIKATGDGGYELLDVAIVDGTGKKDLITDTDLVTVTE